MDVCFAFLNEVYGAFGFDFQLKLSTRPEKFLGEIETWDKAEAVSPVFVLVEWMSRE
jgi:threonyl-tRNA synthetase